YCYARPFHEYLGFSAGLDFETKILVKPNAPELLRRELMSPSWQPQVLMLSGVTDCYQPAERRLEITRRCLSVLAELRNPAAILAAAKEAGAGWAHYLLVRLPFAVKDLFQEWLAEHFPERKEKVLARIRELRGGKLNEPRFGERFRAQGIFAEQLEQMYATT